MTFLRDADTDRRHTVTSLADADIERLARRRAKARMGWITHAGVFLGVNLLHGAVALAHGRSAAPLGVFMLAWAIGLAMHGALIVAFGSGSGLHEWLVARERARLLAQRDPW